jgi:type I restriction enzyme, S subunit
VSDYPQGWVTVPLDQILVRIVGGGTPSKSNADFFRGAKPFMTVKDMHERFPTDTIDHITEEAIDSSATTVIPADTIIVATRMSLGKVVRPKFDTAINQDLKALFFADGIDKTFAEYFWRSRADHIQSLGTGTTVKGIRLEDIRSLQIDLPSTNEQKRIADKLDAVLARVDACRDRLDRIPTILKRFRQSVLAAATSGKLTEDWREMHPNMEEWSDVKLSDIADIQGGVTKDSKKQSLDDEEVPYLRVANVQRGYIDLTEVKTIRVPANKLKNLLLEPGDIFFNEGGDIDKLGRGWIWEGQIERCSFQNHVFRARLHDKSNQPKYISWWGNSRGLDFFLRAGKQTTNLASINKSLLSGLPIRLPPGAEQAEIVRRVENLFGFADRLEARYNAARAQVEKLTPAMLAKAFRGELVPQDPNDEPASALLERIKFARADGATKPKRARTTDSAYVPKKLKEKRNMTKSRQDDDVREQPYLAAHLRRLGGSARVESLFDASELPVADFYKQLAWEVSKNMVRDAGEKLELGDAA